MKLLIDARSVLKEDPPMEPADAIKSVINATIQKGHGDIGSLAWKERPARYEKVIRAVVTNLKVDESIRLVAVRMSSLR